MKHIMTGFTTQIKVTRRNLITNKMQEFIINKIATEVAPVSDKIFEVLYNKAFIDEDGVWTREPMLWGLFFEQLSIRRTR